jgi:hypothetical protein
VRPGRDGALRSLVTGLTLRPEGLRLRLVDTATGEPLPRSDELRPQMLHERARRLEAEARLQQSESRGPLPPGRAWLRGCEEIPHQSGRAAGGAQSRPTFSRRRPRPTAYGLVATGLLSACRAATAEISL